MEICGIYKITNTATGDFYIGSSKNVKQRLACHKCKSTWNEHPNNPLYLDMQKYGLDKFEFEIIEEVEIEQLKKTEQEFIELLKPTYNQMNANGLDIERMKKTQKEYHKEYNKSDKHKEYKKQYNNQLCSYNGQTLTLCALSTRFRRQGLSNPTIEAKKYLLNK